MSLTILDGSTFCVCDGAGCRGTASATGSSPDMVPLAWVLPSMACGPSCSRGRRRISGSSAYERASERLSPNTLLDPPRAVRRRRARERWSSRTTRTRRSSARPLQLEVDFASSVKGSTRSSGTPRSRRSAPRPQRIGDAAARSLLDDYQTAADGRASALHLRDRCLCGCGPARAARDLGAARRRAAGPKPRAAAPGAPPHRAGPHVPTTRTRRGGLDTAAPVCATTSSAPGAVGRDLGICACRSSTTAVSPAGSPCS
jgi:hypothetical protein